MIRIKKIETPSKQNWMDDLKDAIEATLNSFICAMKANIDGMEVDLKKGHGIFEEGRGRFEGRWDKAATRKTS